MQTYERKIDFKLLLSIIAAGIMTFSGVVVETAMNVTFPTLMHEFGVSTSTVQWITTGYLLILSIIIPVSSYLKRRFRMKALFTSAIIMFITGTLMSAFAPVFSVLLLGRIIQGIGTGIALPLMFNIILEQVPGKKLGMMMGIATLVIAIAPAVGPSLGGLIVKHFGWRIIFISLLPLLIFSLICGIYSIRQVTETSKIPFMFTDYLLLAAAFISFIFAISAASSAGWLSVPVLALFLISLLMLALFCRRSLRSRTPLIDVRVFTHKPFTLSVLSIIFIQAVCLGLGFLLPNYAQIVNHQDAFLAGCLLLPGCTFGAALAPISGRLLDRFGAAKPIITGNVLIVLSLACFSLYSGTFTPLVTVIFYVFFAFGQGCSCGNTMTNGLSLLPRELKADGNAVITTMQQLAGALGTTIVTTIVAAAQTSHPGSLAFGTAAGTRYSFYMLAALSLICFYCSVSVFLLTGRKQKISAPCESLRKN